MMTYSLAILNGVRPEPSTKQAGKAPPATAAKTPAVSRPYPVSTGPTRTRRSMSSGAARRLRLSRARAATQSWVAAFAPSPGKTPIPRKASVWTRSIAPTKGIASPRKSR